MPTAPTCLFLSSMREHGDTAVGWSAAAGATRYRLEAVYDQTFDQAVKGFSWATIKSKNKTWNEMEAATMNWLDIEALPTALPPDCFVVWEGAGEAVSEPDRGLMWYQLDSRLPDWQSIDQSGTSWQQLEQQPGRGQCWRNLDARYLTWSEREAAGLAWDELEWEDADSGDNRYTTLTLPTGCSQSSYRVSCFDGTGYSGGTTSTPQTVVPLFYRSGAVRCAVTAGRSYVLQLYCGSVADFGGIVLRLRYNGYLLGFDALVTGTGSAKADTATPLPNAQVVAQQPNELSLACTRTMQSAHAWDGLLCGVRFVAHGSGIAEFTLQ